VKPVIIDAQAEAELAESVGFYRFPFIIHYVDLPDSVWIVAFAHTSRKPGYWQKRL
jgi:hypothetical protein